MPKQVQRRCPEKALHSPEVQTRFVRGARLAHSTARSRQASELNCLVKGPLVHYGETPLLAVGHAVPGQTLTSAVLGSWETALDWPDLAVRLTWQAIKLLTSDPPRNSAVQAKPGSPGTMSDRASSPLTDSSATARVCAGRNAADAGSCRELGQR